LRRYSDGKWTRLDDGRLKIEGRAAGSIWKEVYEVEIDGEDLTLKNVGGAATQYRKVTTWSK
jgi:hypothetical protein